METQIFVNLPVRDLDKSIAFFAKLGYSFNPQFTDNKATCMVISNTIYVMLVVEEYFKTFTKKAVSDANHGTEVIISLSTESRDKVDEIIDKALLAGALIPDKPKDYGWMYQHGFQDLDGHLWEILYMDMDAFNRQKGSEQMAQSSI